MINPFEISLVTVFKLLARANNNLQQRWGSTHRRICLQEIGLYSRTTVFDETNAKTSKGEYLGVLTGILYLAPGALAGLDVCPGASAGCLAACLAQSGHGQFYSTERARAVKTLVLFTRRQHFFGLVRKSIQRTVARARVAGLTPAIRLNGTSDIDWREIIREFPDVQFYDYTKVFNRVGSAWDLPNYSLTYSRSECNEARLPNGNVAVVFLNTLPETWNGRRVIDGTLHDVRFLDPPNVVVGLIAKGRKAQRDYSGFVVREITQNFAQIA